MSDDSDYSLPTLRNRKNQEKNLEKNEVLSEAAAERESTNMSTYNDTMERRYRAFLNNSGLTEDYFNNTADDSSEYSSHDDDYNTDELNELRKLVDSSYDETEPDPVELEPKKKTKKTKKSKVKDEKPRWFVNHAPIVGSVDKKKLALPRKTSDGSNDEAEPEPVKLEPKKKTKKTKKSKVKDEKPRWFVSLAPIFGPTGEKLARPRKGYVCPFTDCQKLLHTSKGLKSHLLRHTDISRTHVCQICTIRCHKASGLKAHYTTAHSLDQDKQNVLACQFCRKRFSHQRRLKKHIEKRIEKREGCKRTGAMPMQLIK